LRNWSIRDTMNATKSRAIHDPHAEDKPDASRE
jgi:hypothetical protein